MWPQYGDSEWPTLTVNSRISEDPWYVEVSAANIPAVDDYRREGVVGIVSADSPLILRRPPDWLLAAAGSGQETWSGMRHMSYEGGLKKDTANNQNFDLELFVTRGYTDIVFQESGENIFSFNWDTLKSEAPRLNLVKAGTGTPTPTPSPTPTPTPTFASGDLMFSDTSDGGVAVAGFNGGPSSTVVVPGFVTTPDGTQKPVTSIGREAFLYQAVQTLVIPEGVVSIGYAAFGYAGFQGRVLTLPSTLTYIGDAAFAYCSQIEEVSIPPGVTDIPFATFHACGRLNNLSLPAGLKTIGAAAFSNSGITTLTIPDGVTSIGDRAFKECYNLLDVTIPSSVISIGEGAFNSRNIQRVTIPERFRGQEGFIGLPPGAVVTYIP